MKAEFERILPGEGAGLDRFLRARVGLQPNPISKRVAETLNTSGVPVPSSALRRDQEGTESAPVRRRPDRADGHMSDEGRPRREIRSHKLLRFLLTTPQMTWGCIRYSKSCQPLLIERRSARVVGLCGGRRMQHVDSSFHPVRNRDGSSVGRPCRAGFGDDRMLLSLLYVFNAQCSQFRLRRSFTTQQNGQCRIVPLTSKACTVWRQQ